MEADSGIALTALKVDGGASANDFLMETQADILKVAVERPECVETTAMGAAYLAGLAVGYYESMEEIEKNWSVDTSFLPKMKEEDIEKRLKGWKKAVKQSYHWALDE